MSDLPDEFSLIETIFAPLAGGLAGAFALTDDAAVLAPAAGCQHVLTVDALIEGVHFRADDPAALVGRKCLRVNLSDLAAMGARPVAYLLAIALSPRIDCAWLAAFAGGLAEDQAAFGIGLAGGDTTATPGPLTVSITAVGEVGTGRALRRSAARPGDDVYVSGSIGDAALGLVQLSGGLAGLTAAQSDDLAGRYRLPQPRVALGVGLVGVAHAAIDVSDGLIADLGHIASASRVAIEISSDAIPLSPAAQAAIAVAPELLRTALTGGDDYELAFTAPAAAAPAVVAAAEAAGVAVSRIGRVVASDSAAVRVADAAGRALELGPGGFRHF